MAAQCVPILLPGLEIDAVVEVEDALEITAHSTGSVACCPTCHMASTHIHSYYRRQPADLPVSERKVRLILVVRRFRCRNPACAKVTFTEPLPELAARYSRRTQRLETALEAVAFALGGQAGSRLAGRLQMPCSGDTLLRLIRKAPPEGMAPPVVIGVDDWAKQRGRVYGTILVDLERRRAIDLLDDRSAETLAAWLRAQPDLQVLARDRSLEYARGATLGAPHCQQVADRWHLLSNLREALERLLDRLRRDLARLPAPVGAKTPMVLDEIPPMRSPDVSGHRLAQQQGRHARRQALFQAVHQLHAGGVPIRQIARRLHLARGTVRRYLAAEACPIYSPRSPQPSLLDPVLGHLCERWGQGYRNASHLWGEIRAQGFPGSRSLVGRWVRARRETIAPQTPDRYRPQFLAGSALGPASEAVALPKAALPSSRQLVWSLLRPPDQLSELEAHQLMHLRQLAPIEIAYDLAQRFIAMVRERAHDRLDDWLLSAQTSKVKEMRSFADSLRKDYAAVSAALQSQWSNGQTEGQINKLKLYKRMMYGRAKLDLLRARLLRPA